MKTLYFSKIFLSWYDSNSRNLPWRSDIKPYNVWIAEIIFQQTRISQGLDYYNRFIVRFPDVDTLAGATEEEVLKLWQGLGYYSRARNLFSAAQQIVYELNGIFPSTYDEIKKLKGVGDYTAAAIASIAFNIPVAAIDGNVYRVLSRLFAIDEPVDSRHGKEKIKQLANQLIDVHRPGDFNQAIMEFGALHCTPQNPKCLECPLQNECRANATQTVYRYPIKTKKTKVSFRYFNYIIFEIGNFILFNKREGNDIWKNMYDFPLIETDQRIHPELFVSSTHWKQLFKGHPVTISGISEEIVHQLSHQKIHARFYKVSVSGDFNFDPAFISVDKKDIFALPIPKVMEEAVNALLVD